jgi:hypothetical protein
MPAQMNNFLSWNIMKNLFQKLSCLCVIFLAACGGGGNSSTFTVTRAWEGTTYSCPTQATYDVCRAGSCAQCTCTVGCDANAPKAKLTVTMAPAALTVDQAGALSMSLSNAASVSQTVAFQLNYPAGGVGYNSFSFSAPCTTPALSVGGQSFTATVVVPPNTLVCSFDVQKSFVAPANPVAFSLSNLDKVELQGSLPNVTVTASVP